MKKLILTIIISSISLIHFVSAQTMSDIDVFPTFPNEVNPQSFYFELKPGESITEYLSITNRSQLPIKLSITPVDQSGEGFKTSTQEQTEFGSWTKTNYQKTTIGPSEYIEIPFTTEIPNDAAFSKYSGGISVKIDSENQVTSRVLIPVYFEVKENPQRSTKFTYSNQISQIKTILVIWPSLITLLIVGFVILIHPKKLKKTSEKD